MDELEQTLQRVLSDPEEMAKISRLAAQLMGGGPEETAKDDSAPEKTGPGPAELLKGVFSAAPGTGGGNGGGKGDVNKTALLNALAPYLREDRRKKLQKAMRLARAARVAGVVLNEFGGEGDGL